MIRLSKMDAAESQRATAIRLHAEKADPVSVHTLPWAAYDILHDIGRPMGLEAMLKGARFLSTFVREFQKRHPELTR